MGDNVYIAYGTWISANDEIVIEDEVLIGPYCVFASSNHTRYKDSFRYGKPQKMPIHKGEGCWIAAHCTITAGTKIGKSTAVAANSVALGTLHSNSLYGGSPVRLINNMCRKILFVGSHLSQYRGTKGISEKIAGILHDFDIILVSDKMNVIIRFFDIFKAVLLEKYNIVHIDVFTNRAFIYA
jgi:hypothetical protein